MVSNITAITKITHDLVALYQQRATGELVITYGNNPTAHCQIYFYLGRLVYATGGTHPVRRWYRALQQHCPECDEWLKTARSNDVLWEVELLNQAVNQGLIRIAQAKALIQQIVQEVIFTVVEQPSVEFDWRPSQKSIPATAFLAVEQVVREVQQLRNEWRAAGLGHLHNLASQFSPDLSPILTQPEVLKTQVSPEAFNSMAQVMEGKHTLWDVAIQMQRPLPSILRALLPLLHQGVIELQEIPDLPPPVNLPTTPATPVAQKKGLIACIDDSPAIGQVMTQILEPAGYEVITITNPLQGISNLLNRKPDLIFLDLVMPNTNGYELCTFLRKTSAFQSTPIVILTGHDGVIDRVRAKLVGSSDFLAKPPEAEAVLQTAEKFLAAKPTGMSYPSSPSIATT